MRLKNVNRISRTAGVAASCITLAAGIARGQVVDTKIPLNFNSHVMVHASEQVATDTPANADSILFRAIADRGLYWDATNPNAFGSAPLIGGTGMTYGLFNTVGYGNTVAANASTYGLDGIFLGSRVWDRGLEFAPNALTSTGSVVPYAPVYDIVSLVGDGATATATTSAPHGLIVGQKVAILGATPAAFDGEVVVASVPTSTSFTYAASANASATGSIFTNSTSTAQALYVTSDGGTMMAVKTVTAHTFGIGGANNITISGSNIPEYNVQGLTMAIAATAASVQGATPVAGTATVTTTFPHGFATGDLVTMSGASPAGFNATNTVVTVTGPNTFTYTNATAGTPTGTILATNPRVFYMANAGGGTGTASGTRIVAATDVHDTAPEVTTLASPITVDATSEIGVLYMISDSGGPFETVLTFSDGSTSTDVVAKLASADWFGNSAEVGTYSTFVSLHKRMAHTVSGTTYTTFQGASNNDSATLAGFLPTNAGPNLQVTEGIISIPNIIASGVNVAGQQLTKVTFRNALTNQFTALTGVTSDGATATASVSSVNGYIVGQPIEITGVAQAATTTATGLSGDGFTATATTALPHGLINGQMIVVTGATPSTFNTVATGVPITVTGVNTFTYANATSGVSTAAGTATVVAGPMPLNGVYKVTSVDAIANRFTYDCSAVTNNSAASILLNNSAKITGTSSSGGVITVTTLNPHGLTVGDTATLSGFTTANLNGAFAVLSTPTSTTFTLRNPTASSSSAQRTVNRFGRGRGYSIYAATVRSGAPANATCASAQPISAANPIGISVSGTNAHTSELSPPTHSCGAGDSTAVYYTYTPTGNDPVTLTTCASFANNVSVYTGACGALTQVTSACATSSTALGCGGSSSPNVSATLTFVGAAGTQYYIRVAGQSGAMGSFTLTVQEFSNVSCGGATPIAAGDTFGQTLNSGGVSTTPCGGGNDTTSVWYQYTATGVGDHLVEARTCLDGQSAALTPKPQVTGVTGVRTTDPPSGSMVVILPLDTTLAVYSDCSGGAPIACNDDGCSVSSRLQWTATPGVTYLIRVAGKNAALGAFILHIDDPIHTDLTVPLQFNWNGICHGTANVAGPNFFSEQCVNSPQSHENRSDVNGFRAISDRGLLFDPNHVTPNAFNYGGTIGYKGMSYDVYDTPLQVDMVHIGTRTSAGFQPTTQTWADPVATTTPSNGYLPLWLPGDHAAGTAAYSHASWTSSVTGLNAVWGANSKLGFIYHMTNVPSATLATFDVTLTFADSSSVTITVTGTDWFGGNSSGPYNEVLPTASATSGVESQRILGIYNAVQNFDRGDSAGATGALKVDEAVISTASLLAMPTPFDATAHGVLTSVTFGHIVSTDASTNLGIFAATLRDPSSFNLDFSPSGIGTVTPNQLNAGGTGKMKVIVSRGSGSPNNITSVVVNAQDIGLSSSLALNDSGMNGDTTANDNTWSLNVSFPINTVPNAFSLPFTVTDAQGRTATGSIIFSIVAPSGTLNPSTVAQGGDSKATFVFGASGGISSVILDASQIGLSGAIALNDSGVNGDTTASDGTWNVNFTVPAQTTPGVYNLPFVITDTASNTASGMLALTVILPPPANDTCATPQALMANSSFSGDNTQATSIGDGAASGCQANVFRGVWFSFTTGPADAGTWLISTCGSGQDTVLTLYNAGATCATADSNVLACNDDAGVGCAGNEASLSATLAASSTYLIRMQSFQDVGGFYTILVSPLITGACCSNTSGACTLTTSSACNPTSSTYQGDNVACPTTCPVSGVCCNNTSGSCTTIFGGSCPTGTSPGSGLTCDANSCPAVGTCCDNATGTCAPTFTFSCAATATFNSATTCIPAPCTPSGSCCDISSGACALIYGGFCPNGTSDGQGLTCTPATCPVIGVCCDPVTSACSLLYGGICPGFGAFDPSTTCSPPPCTPIAWACCLADTSCVSLFQNDCAARGGLWQPGSSCGTFDCPASPNLVVNPGAETHDMSGWSIDLNGGNGWSPDDNGVPVHSGTRGFGTSYGQDTRHQEIDLLAGGFSEAQLDGAPNIVMGEWVAQRANNGTGGQYFMHFELRDADHNPLASFDYGTAAAMLPIATNTPYFEQSHTFSGYGPGVRYLYFADGGIDNGFWAGPFGPAFDDAFAGVALSSACCSPTGGCTMVSNADCINAGGAPAAGGTTCTASPCGGVCCRGATCNTSIAQAGCTVGSGMAGAFFSASSSSCNSGAVSHTPCCYANYNKVNGITVQDIFDFLSDWFAGNPYAKVGADGATTGLTVQNIFDFLSDWFTGGCS